ncbi:MAG TPA: DUF1573 domain-containing protein, partial [Spirochaetia bacterium]|nr:DUF1573 domain-containing protein [Spirochaetia bacterium]
MHRHRASRPVILFVLLLSSGLLHAAAMSPITFSPEVWKFGAIAQGARVQMTVVVSNHSRTPATVTFVSTCSCLTVAPISQVVAAGGNASFALGYDSTDDTGNTAKAYIVRTDLPGEQRLSYILRGTVRAEHPASPGSAWTRQDTTAGSAAQPPSTAAEQVPRSTVAAQMPRSTVAAVSYYYTPGCRSCEEFLSTEVPRLEKKLGIKIDIQRKDVLDPALYEELSSFALSQGQSMRAIPALRIGTTLLQGDQEIRAHFAEVLTSSVPPTPAAAAAPAPLSDRLAVLPVVAAGLLDGLNPCAFTTLIFLLASLALAGRG